MKNKVTGILAPKLPDGFRFEIVKYQHGGRTHKANNLTFANFGYCSYYAEQDEYHVFLTQDSKYILFCRIATDFDMHPIHQPDNHYIKPGDVVMFRNSPCKVVDFTPTRVILHGKLGEFVISRKDLVNGILAKKNKI